MNAKLSRVLYIDLSTKRFWIEERGDLFEKYLGGTGVATQLLHEECPKGIDPLSPENPIIFAIGPLTGVYPFASKTVAMFKSPHTGDLGESHAGGRSAIAIRMAGYGAIVIKGKSEFPIYLSIKDKKVEFKDAATLWGMKSSYTVGDVIRENETEPGLRSIMRIGLAGEKMVTYAGVVTETYRHFGRMGLGAVFGSKFLKAIAIAGKNTIDVLHKKDYTKHYRELYEKAVNSTVMKKYHDLGTTGNILPLNRLEALPTKNLQQATFDEAQSISGEHIAEEFLGRRIACSHCPTGCVHLASLREPCPDEPYFYKTTMVGYDYELVYALGSMVGISDPESCLKLIDIVEKFCLDSMTTGVVLSWATEMMEKGMITAEHTDSVALQWGHYEEYIRFTEKIVTQPNQFYKDVARGVVYAADIYGGKEFAMAFGKNEMAGYHTGPAAYLGFLIGTRHSHLDNAGYSLDQTVMINENPTPQQVVQKLMDEESLRQIVTSSVMCYFARGIYDMETLSQALAVLGIEKSAKDLVKIGNEIYKEKYRFKIREGFSFDKLYIPERIYETKDPTGKITRQFMQEGIEYAKKMIVG